MPSEPLPQSLQKYINLMKLADKPLFFSEIVVVVHFAAEGS